MIYMLIVLVFGICGVMSDISKKVSKALNISGLGSIAKNIFIGLVSVYALAMVCFIVAVNTIGIR